MALPWKEPSVPYQHRGFRRNDQEAASCRFVRCRTCESIDAGELRRHAHSSLRMYHGVARSPSCCCTRGWANGRTTSGHRTAGSPSGLNLIMRPASTSRGPGASRRSAFPAHPWLLGLARRTARFALRLRKPEPGRTRTDRRASALGTSVSPPHWSPTTGILAVPWGPMCTDDGASVQEALCGAQRSLRAASTTMARTWSTTKAISARTARAARSASALPNASMIRW